MAYSCGDMLFCFNEPKLALWSRTRGVVLRDLHDLIGYLHSNHLCVVICSTNTEVLVLTNKMVLGWVRYEYLSYLNVNNESP